MPSVRVNYGSGCGICPQLTLTLTLPLPLPLALALAIALALTSTLALTPALALTLTLRGIMSPTRIGALCTSCRWYSNPRLEP